MIRPITPQAIAAAKAEVIPEIVIQAVNALIVYYWQRDRARMLESAIVNEVVRLSPGLSLLKFDYKWMEFEEIYRQAGWHVEYDKPGGEDYRAAFTFKRP